MRRVRPSLLATTTAVLLLTAGVTATARADDSVLPLPNRNPIANAAGGNIIPGDVNLQNPSKDMIRRYVQAFRMLELHAQATVDDGRGSSAEVEVGPLDIPNGTQLNLQAKFDRNPGDPGLVLRTFRFEPSEALKIFGPVRFRNIRLDEQARLRLKLDLGLFGMSLFPQEMIIKGVSRDGEGNTVLDTDGTGLIGAVMPKLRITPDGRLQWSGLRIPIIGIRIMNDWRDVAMPGSDAVSLPRGFVIQSWPPTLDDLLALMPSPTPQAPGARGPAGGFTNRVNTITNDIATGGSGGFDLAGIPLTEISVHLAGEIDEARFPLPQGAGQIAVKDGRIELRLDGRLDNGTLQIDPSSGFSVTGMVEGDIGVPGMVGGTLAPSRVDLSGDLSGFVPLGNIRNADIGVNFAARADGNLDNLQLADGLIPGGIGIDVGGRVRALFEGTGSARIRPGSAKPFDFDVASNFDLSTDGPMSARGLSGLAPAGVNLPDSFSLTGDGSGRPVARWSGSFGTQTDPLTGQKKLDFGGSNTEVSGVLANDAAVGFGNGSAAASGALAAGTRIDANIATGPNGVDIDARIDGQIRDTNVQAGAITANAPATDVDLRLSMNSGRDAAGNSTGFNRIRAQGSVGLAADGQLTAPLPFGGQGDVTLGNGTTVSFDTGDLVPTANGGLGHRDPSQREARVRTHLVLPQASAAFGNIVGSVNGSEIDLDTALGLNFDPATGANVDADLDLAIDFPAGSSIRVGMGQNSVGIRMGSGSRVTLHTQMQVGGNGSPLPSRIDNINISLTVAGIDANLLLGQLGQTGVALNKEVTFAIQNASVEFGPNGVRIGHQGIIFELVGTGLRLGLPGTNGEQAVGDLLSGALGSVGAAAGAGN